MNSEGRALVRFGGVGGYGRRMDQDTSLLGLLWRHFEATGYQATLQSMLPPGADLQQGFQELKLLAAKAGLEAYEAELRGVPLSAAVGDEQSFPLLFRIHVGLRDMFTLELPKEIRQWAERALALGPSGHSDELQLQLGKMATDPTLGAGERALARFGLFEFLCMGLQFADYAERGQLAALGIERRHLDELAEDKLTTWLQLPAEQAAAVRPLNVMLAAALEHLTVSGDVLQQEFLTLSADIVEAAEERKVLEQRLQEMNSPDALLIRNAMADVGLLDEQYLTIETLQDQHSLALGTMKRNTLDQRLRRLKVSIKDGNWPKRKSPAVIDLVLLQLPQGEEE